MANEIQTLTFSDTNAIGGTWTVTFDGQTTGALAHNIDAATLQTALEALINIGSGNCTVSGSVAAGFTVEFVVGLADQNLPEMTVDYSGLIMAASTVNVTTDPQGVTPVDAVAEVFTVHGNGSTGVTEFTDGLNAGNVEFAGGLYIGDTNPGTYTKAGGGGALDDYVTYTCNSAAAVPDQAVTSGDGTISIDTQGVDAVAGVYEVQTLTRADTPTAGTWKPAGTTSVNWDGNELSHEAAVLNDTGETVPVTGVYGGNTPTFTFSTYGPKADLTPDGSGLTKSWTGTITPATTQEGSAAGGTPKPSRRISGTG